MKGLEIIDKLVSMLLKNKNIAFLLIIILGAFLRLFNLMYYPSYHHDEGVYMEYSKNLVLHGELSLFGYGMLSHPPLFIFLAGVMSFIFNLGLFGARLLSAIFGILSIALVYMIAKTLYNKNVALLSALFISTSTLTVLVNRMYLLDSSTEFFFLLTFLFVLKYFHNPKILYVCLIGLGCGFALLSKLMGISTIIFVFLIFMYYKKPKKHLLLINVIAFSILAIYPLLLIIKNPSFSGIAVHVEQSQTYNSSLHLLFKPGGDPSDLRTNNALYLIPGIFAFILMVYKPKKENYFIIFAFISIITTFIIHGHIVARYFPVLLAVISIILAKFLMEIYDSRERVPIFVILFIIPISYIAAGISTKYYIYLFQAIVLGVIFLSLLLLLGKFYSNDSNKFFFKLSVIAVIFLSVFSMAIPQFIVNSNLDADQTIEYIDSHTNKTDIILSNPIIATMVDCKSVSYYYGDPDRELNLSEIKYFIHDINDELDFIIETNKIYSIINWTVEKQYDDFTIYRNPER